jgi:hypothetical protein
MRRRGFLALLAPLTAGCLGGVEVSRQGRQAAPATETPAPGAANESAGGTENATATATPTPESTPAGTPEPSEAERREAEARIRTARDHLDAAVSAYAGVGGVADVAADDEAFVARDVYVELVSASGAVEEARALAVTDEQADRAATLAGVVAFLTRATDGQAAMAAGRRAMLDVPATLREGDVAEARALVDEFDTHREEIREAASLVRSESSEADLEATEVVADDAWNRTLEKFDAAATALDEATRPTRALVDGVERLVDARTAVTDDDDDAAREAAGDAEFALDRAAEDLAALADEVPTEAPAFAAAAERLADYARARADEATDIRDDY